MSKEFERQKRAIWGKHERAIGVPIPEEFRAYVENELLSGINDSDGLQDLDDSIPSYLGLINIWVNSHPHRSNGSLWQSETESGENTIKKKSTKWFERRLHLVEFISTKTKALTVDNLLGRSFTPHKRIKWRSVCDEWNKEHPYDLMTPAVIKVEYYRAIAEPDIQREYFDRRYREIERWHKAIKEHVPDSTEELLKKLLARAMPILESGGEAAIRIAKALGCLELYRQPDFKTLVSFLKIYLSLPDSVKLDIMESLLTELEAKEAQNENTGHGN